MREKTVRMFYCDHCPKKGQRRDVIAKHEASCVRNPLRTCGMCGVQYDEHTVGTLAATAKEGLDALRTHCEECPTCMVIGVNTAMRDTFAGGPLSGDHLPDWYEELSQFDYKQARASWWARVNEEKFIADGGIYGL